MEVVNEADAPALPLEAAPHEGEKATDAPAPPPPDAPPLAPAPPEIARDEAPPFQRPTLRIVFAAPFWAGLLGSGTWGWFAGMIMALRNMDLLPRLDVGVIFLPFLPALTIVLTRGFRAPVRSYGELVGRVLGALFFGLLWAVPAGLAVGLLSNALGLRDVGASVALMLLGAPMIGLALARIHGISAERPRRIKIAAAVAAVLFVSCWPGLPSLRCHLGFTEGCRTAADSSGEQGDHRAAAELGAKGCRGEDSFSCRLAGEAYRHEGPARNLRLAEDMFREGCALGDPPSCDRVHGIELERRCERYGASACVELAQAHNSGRGVERSSALAERFYRKACLLGADDACKTLKVYY